eukprot:scaffold239128_cov51-Attheya_sp.AAC.1
MTSVLGPYVPVGYMYERAVTAWSQSTTLARINGDDDGIAACWDIRDRACLPVDQALLLTTFIIDSLG